MGGYGSGNWYRSDSRATTESQHRIDIRWLKGQGDLQPGSIGALSWSWGKDKTGSVRYRVGTDRMVLSYRYRHYGGAWEPVELNISFDQTPCNYGGYRKWFHCPRCWTRVAVLYGAGKYFLCRHCYNLTYSSQQEGKVDRLIRKARKIRRQLGASENLFEPIIFKPKNMHQKTFDRLRQKADQANNVSGLICGQQLGINFNKEPLGESSPK
jgi:hypothetical protein